MTDKRLLGELWQEVAMRIVLRGQEHPIDHRAMNAVDRSPCVIDSPEIRKEHEKSSRVFGMVQIGPRPMTVHLHSDILNLEPVHIAGIMLHEIGHLGDAAEGYSSSESRADAWVRKNLGVTIHYTTRLRLETVSEKEARRYGVEAD